MKPGDIVTITRPGMMLNGNVARIVKMGDYYDTVARCSILSGADKGKVYWIANSSLELIVPLKDLKEFLK